jgi:hypothetical protein
LADLVNQVFDISGFVLSSIQNELNKAWEGVKSAGEFIVETMLITAIDAYVFIISNIFKTISELINSISPNLGVTSTTNGMIIGDFEINVYREDLNLIVQFNDLKLNFNNFIFDQSISIETLGMEKAGWLALSLSVLHVVLMSSIQLAAVAQKQELVQILTFSGITAFAMLILTWIGIVTSSSEYTPDQKKDFIINIWFFLLLSFLFNVLIFGTPDAKHHFAYHNPPILEIFRLLDVVLNMRMIALALGFNDLFDTITQNDDDPDLTELVSIAFLNLVFIGLVTVVNPMISDKSKPTKSDNKGLHGMRDVHKFVKLEMVIMIILLFVLGLWWRML